MWALFTPIKAFAALTGGVWCRLVIQPPISIIHPSQEVSLAQAASRRSIKNAMKVEFRLSTILCILFRLLKIVAKINEKCKIWID